MDRCKNEIWQKYRRCLEVVGQDSWDEGIKDDVRKIVGISALKVRN